MALKGASTPIVIGDLTDGDIDGSGTFDLMMKSVKSHLQEEYNTGRIKGSDYATVYLGAIQTTMDRALSYVMTHDEEDAKIRVADATQCKLDAEFDVLVLQAVKVTAETNLLNQRKITEVAQTNGTAVTSDSLLGKQIALFQKQADGFTRDAEQKAAAIMADTWNIRRTTDEGTVWDEVNHFQDSDVGRVIIKMIDGIGA